MDELTDLAKIVLTAAGTLGVGLIVGVVTWVIQAKREHSKWVREKRFELYTEIAEFSSTIHLHAGKHGVTPTMMGKKATEELGVMFVRFQEMDALMARLNFVGPKGMYKIGTSLFMAADSISGAPDSQEETDSLRRFTNASMDFAVAAAKTLKL